MSVAHIIPKLLHVVCQSDLALLVADDGELEVAAGDLVDVLDPAAMALNGVGAQTDELCTTLGELRLEFGKGAEFGGADWAVESILAGGTATVRSFSTIRTCSPLGERRE